MSGLEKFQAKDDWRSNFKDLLLIERKFPNKQISPEKETSRFSLELSEEFLTFLEEKKISKQLSSSENLRMDKYHKDKENEIHPSNINATTKCCDDSAKVHYNSPLWQRNVDDSFETIERMCDKSASDPNSTLFHYLNKKEKKNVVHQPTCDEEADALQRLLDELKEEEEMHCKAQDETQLDEIEAPSRFWENTSLGESILHTPPVKVVGSLRPSIILEEISSTTVSEANSSSSFQSALKCSETTDCYDTASSIGGCCDKNEDKTLAKSFNLIDLNESCISFASSFSDEGSVIEILSDDEEELTKKFMSYAAENNNLKTEQKSESFRSEVNGTSLSTSKKQQETSDEEEDNNSMHFNDTMEEVDYMIKKGMEYMEAENNAASINFHPSGKHDEKQDSPESCIKRSNKYVGNPCKPFEVTDHFRSPTVNLKVIKVTAPNASPNTKKTFANRFIPETKSSAKVEMFKKPFQNNLLSAQKKQAFSHIVSPVGAYIKKTGTTPLMSDIRPKKTDLMNSSTFRKLEYESRSIHPFLGAKKEMRSNTGKSPGGTCSLPKKAYISSEFKQVSDERKPKKIPGGDKIQRYLHSAFLPAVVRHDGKVKSSSAVKKSEIPRDSFADLSMMSGDVSLYTIKDAQKL